MAEVGTPTGGESSLSNWVAPYVTDMLGKGWGQAEQPYTAYQGPLTAGPSALQQQAFSGIANLTVPGGGTYTPSTFTSGYTPPATPYAPGAFDAGSWNTGAATQYMNPYLSTALNPQLDEIRRQSDITRINDAGRLTQAGAYGGSRQAIMESELNRNMMGKMADVTGTGYRDAYDRALSAWQGDMGRGLQAQQMGEQSRQFGAGQSMSAADTAARYGLEANRMGEQSKQFGAGYGLDALTKAQGLTQDMLRAGEIQRGIESEGIMADMRQFEQERDYPYKMTQFMQSLLQGLPIAAQSYNYTEPSDFNQFMGGASGVATLIGELQKLYKPATTPATGGN